MNKKKEPKERETHTRDTAEETSRTSIDAHGRHFASIMSSADLHTTYPYITACAPVLTRCERGIIKLASGLGTSQIAYIDGTCVYIYRTEERGARALHTLYTCVTSLDDSSAHSRARFATTQQVNKVGAVGFRNDSRCYWLSKVNCGVVKNE